MTLRKDRANGHRDAYPQSYRLLPYLPNLVALQPRYSTQRKCHGSRTEWESPVANAAVVPTELESCTNPECLLKLASSPP